MLNQEINMSYLHEVKSIEKSEIENYFFYKYFAFELVNFYGITIYTKVESFFLLENVLEIWGLALQESR